MQKSNGVNGFPNFSGLLGRRPQAWATVWGSERYPDIRGEVRFYQTAFGVVVEARIMGLPTGDDVCESPIFGFHIHEGGLCTGNETDPFADAGTHYDPYGCPHPYHAGDLPPLFGAGGYAYAAFLTDRVTVEELMGRVVILHGSPDDFTTQPAGNAGEKIACGVIRG
jgi:Cu-Zn family superoxide dismutase